MARDIVLYHAIGSTVMSSDLATSYVSTLNTATPDESPMSMYINIEDGVKINGDISVTSPDIEADNGVVHVVDKVIMPINIVDAAIEPADGGFLGSGIKTFETPGL